MVHGGKAEKALAARFGTPFRYNSMFNSSFVAKNYAILRYCSEDIVGHVVKCSTSAGKKKLPMFSRTHKQKQMRESQVCMTA